MILAEIIEEYISGDWGNEEICDDTPNEVFCIRGADFVPIMSVDYTKIPTRYISERSYKNKRLKVGDIIIEKSGGSPTQSTGRVILVTEDLLRAKQHIVCSNFCEAFRVKKEWNPFYVFTYLQFLYDEGVFFNFEGKTSGLKNLQMEQAFSSIDVPEQKSDISILFSLDEKIALNRKINKHLEALAQEIYEYWFVQFDFPNEKSKPYKSSGGMMVWNKKLNREIPEGWGDELIDKLCLINNETIGRDDKINTIKYLDTSNICENQIINFQYYKKAEAPSRAQRKVKNRTILYSTVRPSLKHFGILHNPKPNLIVSTGFATIDVVNPYDCYRLYEFITSKYINAYLNKLAETSVSAYPSISPSDIGNLSVTVPSKNIIREFHNMMEPLFKKIDKNSKEIRDFISLRNYLLPLLINGQIKIND